MKETFASWLRETREMAGLSRMELAKRSGLSCFLIESMEQGRRRNPGVKTVLALAEALKKDPMKVAIKSLDGEGFMKRGSTLVLDKSRRVR